MKRLFNFRNTAMALATVLSTMAMPAAHATEDPKTADVELKFLGNFRNKPVFELTFNLKSAENDYVLNIRDEFGNSLYRESIKSSMFTKKFMLNTEEVEDDILRVEVTSRKNDYKIVYEINRNTHVVEEVLINKVN